MHSGSSDESATSLLHRASAGDPSALSRLAPLIYDELRALAAAGLQRERPDHTLQPTALAHEAYLRLIDQTRVQWADKRHFMAVAAEVIRRILVDHARAHKAAKRGGDAAREPLDAACLLSADGRLDVADLDDALKELASLHERQARVVELKFFGGLEVPDIATLLEVSERTVVGDWRFARAWLEERLMS